jgi:hypothetical protein
MRGREWPLKEKLVDRRADEQDEHDFADKLRRLMPNVDCCDCHRFSSAELNRGRERR